MAAVTVCSDFGAQGNEICYCFHFYDIYWPQSDETRCHDLRFLKVDFKASLFTLLFHPHQEALVPLCFPHYVTSIHRVIGTRKMNEVDLGVLMMFRKKNQGAVLLLYLSSIS